MVPLQYCVPFHHMDQNKKFLEYDLHQPLAIHHCTISCTTSFHNHNLRDCLSNIRYYYCFLFKKIAYCLYFRRNIFIWNVHICCYVFLDTYYGCRGAWVCPILAPSDCKIGPSVHYSTVSATPTSEDLQRSHQGFCVYWNWPDECIIHFILTSNEDKWK